MLATNEIINDMLIEALETMAFLSEGSSDEEPVLPDNPICVEMGFKGIKCGTVQILGGSELGTLIAENIACLMDVDQDAIFDAWKEICNVTTGLMIPVIAENTSDVYDVSVPVIKNGKSLCDWNNFISYPETQILNIEGYAVACRLVMDHQGDN